VYTTSQADEGEYNIKVKVSLDNDVKSTLDFSFLLNTIYDPQEYSTLDNTAPFFEVIPTSQTAKFGEAWSYELGPAYDLEDDNV